MSNIQITSLVKTFGGANVIDDVSFTVASGEILVILGASGCGKTTTLRCISGLEQPTSGSIVIDGKTMFDAKTNIPPEHRHLGMMFQSYALWPHKTVYGNIAYGLGKLSDDSKRQKVRDALELVGLSGTEDRYPSTLSGGQQQRIALARSAGARPKVILLDEPLSNLDAKLREQMRNELRKLIKELNMTAVYITHDQSEAMALADKIIFMKNGKIEQEAAPRTIYARPATRAVAEFIGSATFLNGTMAEKVGKGATIDLGNGFKLSSSLPLNASNGSAHVAIRPERVKLSRTPTGSPNEVRGQVADLIYLGEHTEYAIDIGPNRIISRSQLELEPGTDVFVRVAPEDVIPMPAN
ncbi:MAG: ABC transporter ATP-binding protein [Phyllobacterium sp.]